MFTILFIEIVKKNFYIKFRPQTFFCIATANLDYYEYIQIRLLLANVLFQIHFGVYDLHEAKAVNLFLDKYTDSLTS